MEIKSVKLFSETSILVTRAQSILKAHGIDSLVKNQIESARLAGFGATTDTVDLFVLSPDFKKALQIINSFRKEISS